VIDYPHLEHVEHKWNMVMEIISVKDAAKALQVGDETVSRLIKDGLLPAEQLRPRGRYRILKQSLIDYAEKNGITLKQPQDQ